MIKTFIMMILIVIIIFTLGSCIQISTEGFVDYMSPSPDMVKDIRTTSDSDKMLILSEIYSNINKHELAMNIYDPDYKLSEIKMKPQKSILENIQLLYPILYKQDKELVILTKEEYVPSKTLLQLMDGSLIKPMKDDLTKIMNYTPRFPIDQPETDISVILSQADKYQAKINDIAAQEQNKINLRNIAQQYRDGANGMYAAAERSKTSARRYYGSKRNRLYEEASRRRAEGDRSMQIANEYQRRSDSIVLISDEIRKEMVKQINTLKLDAVKKEILNIPGEKIPVDTSPRITQEEIDSRIENLTLFHITKVIKYHDYILEKVAKNAEVYVKKVYNKTIDL
jgi:hypothetical protein